MTEKLDAPQIRLPGPGSHVPELDGVRGLAIAFVMLHHFSFYSGMRVDLLIDKAFYKIGLSGWYGVDLFFVLSGFLITGILCETKNRQSYFRTFFARRALRIFPLYYGFLALWFFAMPLVAIGGWSPSIEESGSGWYWTYLMNIRTMMEGWPSPVHLGHFWSLAIEEQFYLVWPLLVFFLSRKNMIRVCIFVIVLALALRIALEATGNPLGAYVLTPARMDSLGYGALLALLFRNPESARSSWRRVRALAIAATIALVGIFIVNGRFTPEDVAVSTIGLTLLALAFGGLVGSVVFGKTDGWLARILRSRGLMLLGRYSYAIYVIHHPLTIAVRRGGIRVSEFPTIFGSQLVGEALYIVAVGGVSVLLAALSWHLYESQWLKLKRFTRYGRA